MINMFKINITTIELKKQSENIILFKCVDKSAMCQIISYKINDIFSIKMYVSAVFSKVHISDILTLTPAQYNIPEEISPLRENGNKEQKIKIESFHKQPHVVHR